MVLGWTSQPMAFGEDGLRGFTSMYGYSIHMLPPTDTQMSACYRKHERAKKHAYEQHIREVEHASFTPLVLSATGGLAIEATNFYKRLASLLASKWDNQYCTTMAWLRCRLTYSLLRSAIQCIRGARSSHGCAIKSPFRLTW